MALKSFCNILPQGPLSTTAQRPRSEHQRVESSIVIAKKKPKIDTKNLGNCFFQKNISKEFRGIFWVPNCIFFKSKTYGSDLSKLLLGYGI